MRTLIELKKRREYARKYRRKNLIRDLCYHQLLRLAFHEEYLARSRKYFNYKGAYITHKELHGLEIREYKKKYYLLRKDAYQRQTKKYYNENKDIVLRRQRAKRFGTLSELSALTNKLHKEILCQEKQTRKKH